MSLQSLGVCGEQTSPYNEEESESQGEIVKADYLGCS